MTWLSAHVFHHTGIDHLLENAVAPLTADLDEFFYLRYWEGGPHLRLRVRPVSSEVAVALAGRINDHLSRFPSPDLLTAEQYAEIARRLGAAEGVAGFERELRPNNTLEYRNYVPEHDAFDQAVEDVERHFVQSSRIALDLVCGTTARERALFALAAVLFTLTASGSWVALRQPDTAVGFGAAEERYQSRRSWLRSVADEMNAVARGEMEATGPLAEWISSVTELRQRLVAAEQAGTFAPVAPHSTLPPDLSTVPEGERATTAVLMRCAHLLCNRLGILREREGFLRYLASRAVEDLLEEIA